MPIDGSIGARFNVHITLIGKSPPDIVHVTDTGSSKFIGSSPNENGVIFGGTNNEEFFEKSLLFTQPKQKFVDGIVNCH